VEKTNHIENILLILLTILFVWSIGTKMPFLQDDFIFSNPSLMFKYESQPSPKIGFPKSLYFPRSNQCYWRPLTQNLWLANTLNFQAFPNSEFPLLAHLVSIILFWICCIEVYFLSYFFIDNIFPAKDNFYKYSIAQITALIFSCRAIWFLGVVWASGQQELIGFILSIGSVLFFLKHYYLLTAILYSLALLSKENAVLSLIIFLPLIIFSHRYRTNREVCTFSNNPTLKKGVSASQTGNFNIINSITQQTNQYNINKTKIYLCFALPTLIYILIRISYIMPLVEPLPFAAPVQIIENLAASLLMLFDTNREILRNYAQLKFVFYIITGVFLSLFSLVIFLYIVSKTKIYLKNDELKIRKKILIMFICSLICIAPSCLLPSTPYGYYLMYSGILFYTIIGILISFLNRKSKNVLIILFILSGLLGVVYQIYSPSGNYQRAVQAVKHRNFLKTVKLPNDTEKVIIYGFSKSEIWAMGWGFGISLDVEGKSTKMPFDRNHIKFIANEDIGENFNNEGKIKIIIHKPSQLRNGAFF